MSGSIYYKAYVGGWQQGKARLLIFPTDDVTIPNNHTNEDWRLSDAQLYCPHFDNTWTIFAPTETTRNRLIDWGWWGGSVLNFYDYTEQDPLKLYVAPNKYILGYGSGTNQVVMLYVSDVYYMHVKGSGASRSSTFPSLYVVSESGDYPRKWHPGISLAAYNTTLKTYRASNDATYLVKLGGGEYEDKWTDFWQGIEPVAGPGDPYAPGGESGTGGGTGTFDGTSTPIPIPSLPTLSAVDTGFITLFNPSLAQLKNLASYMWSGTFDLNTFKKLFADPMDCILGLSIVPVAVPNGGTQSVMVGNISTGVSMTLAGSQYVVVNCGTINVNEYWGSYLDYAPYSKASIYLPYCGVHPIDIDEIMDRSITVEYHVDILSGACVAFIMCADSVLYSFTGQCASSIPVSGNDFTQMINGIITASTAIGSMVATGGATAPVAVPQLVSTAVNSMKPEVEKSGSLSGTGGMLAIQTPYLILTIPRQALPKDQNTFTGYPSFITSTLGDLSGYTEVEEIHLESIPATDGELSEILNLLKSGVIL